MRELTTRQRDVLNFMRAFSARHGVTPRAAFDHLRALERKGMLQRRAGPGRTARSLTLSEAAGGRTAIPSVPILGRIAAGLPILLLTSHRHHLATRRSQPAQPRPHTWQPSADPSAPPGERERAW